MKLTTFLITAATALNTVVSALDIYMFSAAEIKDDIRIYGKSSSDGDAREMSRALYNPSKNNQPDFCFNQTYGYSLDCNNRHVYSAVGFISFEKPTDQPRNLKINTPSYDLSCDINVRSIHTSMRWVVGWGFFQDDKQFDALDIICKNTTKKA